MSPFCWTPLLHESVITTLTQDLAGLRESPQMRSRPSLHVMYEAKSEFWRGISRKKCGLEGKMKRRGSWLLEDSGIFVTAASKQGRGHALKRLQGWGFDSA